LKTNKTKARLKAGEAVFGCFVRYPNASLVEFLGYQNWDFIIFDGEHGTLDATNCEHMVRAAELRDLTPIARVPNDQPSTILRYLDTGAQGLHVPWVNSAEEASRVIQSVKYQPLGMRGLAGVRAADYGQLTPFSEYVQQANRETLVAIHIESMESVERLPDIVQVEGLDVIFIGPTDLSHSLGVAGQMDHPKLKETMQQIAEIVTQSDVALGLLVGNAQAAQQWRQRGARYITVAFEALVGPAMRQFLADARQ
jgi:4-hydroxy-2-oxoheptanedioate aldolase